MDLASLDQSCAVIVNSNTLQPKKTSSCPTEVANESVSITPGQSRTGAMGITPKALGPTTHYLHNSGLPADGEFAKSVNANETRENLGS
jgi:hypothetical protein